MFKTSYRRDLLPWLVPGCILVAWQATAQLGFIPARILPAPTQVLSAALKLVRSGEIFRHIGVSSLRALAGLLVGGSIGFVFGLLNGLSRTSDRLLNSTFQMVRNVPHLALIPLCILWFGIDEGSKVFLVAFGVFFPIYLNTYHGIQNVDPGLIEMGRVYGLSGYQLFRDILFPAALPSILVGVRYALGIMWLTLIVAETVSASSGIGYMTMTAREFLQTDIIVLGILIYALLGKLADVSTLFLEQRWLAWHPAFQKTA